MFCVFLFIFAAKAIPRPIGRPCPKEPVDASIPLTLCSGWPPRFESTPFVLSNDFKSINFLSAKIAYNAKHP